MRSWASFLVILMLAAMGSLFLWEPQVLNQGQVSDSKIRIEDIPRTLDAKSPINIHSKTKKDVPYLRSNSDSVPMPDQPLIDPDNSNSSDVKNLESIQAELDALPPSSESAAARTLLLNAASSFPMEDQDTIDQVHDMALQELFETSSLDLDQDPSGLQSFSFFLPVLAHELLLRTAFDESEALVVTIEGMAIHSDPGVRQSMMRQFVRYYPRSEGTLRNELFRRELVTQSSSLEVDSQ